MQGLRRSLGLAVFGLVGATLGTCVADTRIQTVRDFNSARDRGDLNAARSMLADDPRIWYENPVGPGSTWKPGESAWAGWDSYFRSEKRLVGEYQRDGDAVFALFTETNGYYTLTERTWSRTMLTWFVDDKLKIRGLLVTGVGESVSRADEFRDWARTSEPAEYAHLFPGGILDPSGDRPPRMAALLAKWRASVGLPSLHWP